LRNFAKIKKILKIKKNARFFALSPQTESLEQAITEGTQISNTQRSVILELKILKLNNNRL